MHRFALLARVLNRLSLIRLASLVLAITLVIPLRGCDSHKTSAVQVELWTLALRPWFDDYMLGQLAAFEKANPGIKVRWVDVAYEALERKLIASAAAGRAPDVVNMADLNFARFAAQGAFLDLADHLPSHDGSADERYLPGALSLCRINGRLLGLPWYLTPHVRIVNEELLGKIAGPDGRPMTADTMPGDWRSLASLAREFHAKTGAYLFSQPLGEESQLPIMLLADGIPPLRDEVVEGQAGQRTTRLRSDLTNPKVEEYLSLFVQLFRDGAMPRDACTKGHAHLMEMYQEGRVAVISSGPNFLRRIGDVAPAIFAHTAVRGGMVGRLNRCHVPVMLLNVTSTSRHPKEAAALAWWLTGPAAQLEFCKQVAIMPSSAESLKDQYFSPPPPVGALTPDAKLIEARRVSAQILPTGVAFTAAIETWPDLRRVFDDEMKHVLLDGADLSASLRKIDREWNRLLDEAAPATMSSVPTPAPAPPASQGLHGQGTQP